MRSEMFSQTLHSPVALFFRVFRMTMTWNENLHRHLLRDKLHMLLQGLNVPNDTFMKVVGIDEDRGGTLLKLSSGQLDFAKLGLQQLERLIS